MRAHERLISRYGLGMIAIGMALTVGCASPGDERVNLWPAISAQEERAAAVLLKEQAERLRLEHERRLLDVGRRLMAVIPNGPACLLRIDEVQEVNAYSDVGIIEVTRGMMRFVKDDDELAVVLAHELAHQVIAARPQRERRPQPDVEREADYLGLTYVYQAGFDLEAAFRFWERMAVELGGTVTESWLSHHPSLAERVVLARKFAASLGREAASARATSAPGAPEDGHQ